MPKILLSNRNIESLKFELKQLFGHIGSSHLIEGIARGLGFNSNAALRVALAQSSKPKLDLREFDVLRFTDWLDAKGYTMASKIPSSCFEEIDDPVWVCSKIDWIRDQWFHSARRNNIPMVHINPRRKYADVHWDFISVDESHEPEKFLREDLDRIAAMVRKCNGKYGFWGVSVFSGTIYQLKIEDAKVVADEIFGLLHNLISTKVAS